VILLQQVFLKVAVCCRQPFEFFFLLLRVQFGVAQFLFKKMANYQQKLQGFLSPKP
jgi:hypothetical protein